MATRLSADGLEHCVLSRRVVRLAPAILLVAVLAVSGCGPGGPLTPRLHADVRRPDPGVVLLICDGLSPSIVDRGCREGWLPNIERRLVAGGTRVEHAVSCIPPITYGAIAAMLTGAGPGRHRVVGNRWFDPDGAFFRNYATIEDYRDVNADCQAPTIYQRLRPAASINIQTAHRRGATKNIANWAVSGTMWFFGDYTAVDKLTASSVARVAGWANTHRQWPSLLTCYFPGVDSVGHEFGFSSPEYLRAVRHLDHQIGRVCDWLENQGLLETTYIVLVSDHGMIDVSPDGVIDLMGLVRNVWGRNATDRMLQDGPEDWRRRYYDRFDTVVAHQNGRGAFLYLRGPGGWDREPEPAAVEAILTAPSPEAQLWNVAGVELVAYLAAEDEAVLRSRRGQARVSVRAGPQGPEYAYWPEPDDVLGYLTDADLAAFVAAGYHRSREWLEATADQTFPDVVPNLIPLLRVRRAGQVVVFTQPGYSFVPEKGGHGGIHRDEMRMVFMLAGPGIKAGGTIDTARAVDLTPTLLDLLGVKHDEDQWLEGVSLLKAGLLSAEPASIVR
jgi:hypothetical protein